MRGAGPMRTGQGQMVQLLPNQTED